MIKGTRTTRVVPAGAGLRAALSLSDDSDTDMAPSVHPVQAILEHRFDMSRGEMYYLVKWEGYGSRHNSWVRGSDMMKGPILEEYLVRTAQCAMDSAHLESIIRERGAG